jgi:hypothetical protein
MATTLSQNALRWTLTPIILAALTATAAAGSFTRGCAARDMQVLMMIEERENTRTVSADQVREAMHQLLHARIVCNEGYVFDALAIYDEISNGLTSTSAMLGRMQPTEIQ